MLALLLGLIFLLAACNPNQPPRVLAYAAVHGYQANIFWRVTDPEGGPVSCTVDFDDGNVQVVPCATPDRVHHTYAASGLYRVLIKATDVIGASTTREVQVSVPSGSLVDCPRPTAQNLSTRLQGGTQLKLQGVHFAKNAQIVPGKLLIKPAPGIQPDAFTTTGVRVLSQPSGNWTLVAVPPGEERTKAQELVAAGLARFVQPVYRYRLLASPNDPYFNGYQSAQFAQMTLTSGWEWLSEKACRPTVAVIDSGADLNHPDLATHLLPGYDFSDGDNDPSDANGHGTMVSGIIGAITNNGQGVAGSTNNLAYVVPAKVFPNAYSTTIADAIRRATDDGAHLINLSLCILNDAGTACADLHGTPDTYIEDALQYAHDHGVIAVAASGNDGNSYIGYPASSAYTLAVGSVDASGNRSSFSNYGPDLDFVAPGESVTNTIPDDTYGTGNGTSFSTPYVVGELALYLGQYYALEGSMPSFSQASTCFQNNTNQASHNDETGFGIPQADQFLDAFDGSCYP